MNDEFKQKHQTDLDKPVTMGVLLEYTDQFLLPKFEEQTKAMFLEYTDESLMPKIKEQTKTMLVEYTDEVLMPKIKAQTKGMLVEYTDEVLLPKVKEQTMSVLLEFTDEFLIPRMAEMIDDNNKELKTSMTEMVDDKIKAANAKQTYEIKSYFSDQLADHTSDMFKRFDKKWEKDKEFRQKVVELFKRHNIGSATDIAYLEGLVVGT